MITLGRLLVKALAINPKSADAQKLTLQGTNGDVLDYGTVVYNVMAERSPAQSSLTVHEVNTYLDLIAEHFKQNERSSKIPFHDFSKSSIEFRFNFSL